MDIRYQAKLGGYMSGDYHTSIHCDIRELEERLAALESKVAQSNLLMRRPGSEDYEKLVDVVCDHDEKLRELDTNW